MTNKELKEISRSTIFTQAAIKKLHDILPEANRTEKNIKTILAAAQYNGIGMEELLKVYMQKDNTWNYKKYNLPNIA